MNHDEEYTRRSIEMARRAAANGNEPFGALLVHDGEVIATAENSLVIDDDVTSHAETNLVRQAWGRFDAETLSEATLYSSTEPCAMCAGAIVNCGIGRVVYSAPADRAREVGGRAAPTADVLPRCGVEKVGPILESEGLDVHRNCWDHILPE
ncbi:MAG: nucleoside deaminase [Halobacteriales archaeon]